MSVTAQHLAKPKDADRVKAILGESVDLLALDLSEPRPWTPGAHRILRPSVKAIMFGPRGVGKSLAAFLLALQVIEAGGSVAYVDLENGARRQGERLDAILRDRGPGVHAAVTERLTYLPHARLSLLKATEREAWAQSFADYDLVVIDSIARALGQLGLDENSAADFATFMVGIIDPIAAQGAAVLLLDNTGHEEQQRTRGSSTKLDLCEVAYKVTADPIAPDRHGTIRLERMRTRDGDEAALLEVEAGDGSYGRVQSALPGERLNQLRREVAEYVAEHPGEGLPGIAKGVGRRRDDVRSELEWLEDAGTLRRAPSEGRDSAGRRTSRTAWFPASHGQLCAVPNPGTDWDRPPAESTDGPGSRPLKGGTVDRGPLSSVFEELTDDDAEERWRGLEAAYSSNGNGAAT